MEREKSMSGTSTCAFFSLPFVITKWGEFTPRTHWYFHFYGGEKFARRKIISFLSLFDAILYREWLFETKKNISHTQQDSKLMESCATVRGHEIKGGWANNKIIKNPFPTVCGSGKLKKKSRLSKLVWCNNFYIKTFFFEFISSYFCDIFIFYIQHTCTR